MSNLIHIPGIFKAIIAVGSQTKLAELLGIKPQSIRGWIKQGYVPLSRVAEISKLTGVPQEQLVDPALLTKA